MYYKLLCSIHTPSLFKFISFPPFFTLPMGERNLIKLNLNDTYQFIINKGEIQMHIHAISDFYLSFKNWLLKSKRGRLLTLCMINRESTLILTLTINFIFLTFSFKCEYKLGCAQMLRTMCIDGWNSNKSPKHHIYDFKCWSMFLGDLKLH